MEYYIYRGDDELYHWGVKGMKWGVRRYQNKDGSLTPRGKKRKAKLEAELAQLKGKKSTASRDAVPKEKTIDQMTNKELQKYTTRMQLEKQYYDAKTNLAGATPKQVSRGQKFADTMLNEVIKPLAKDAGTKLVEAAVKKALGKDGEDALTALKKEYDELDYRQKIDKIKNPDNYLNYEERTKKYKLEKDMKADAKAEADAKAAKQKTEADAKAAKQKTEADAKAAKQKAKADAKTNKQSEKTQGEHDGKREKQDASSSEKVYEGEIIGEGTSKKQSSGSGQTNKKSTVIDAEWYENVTDSGRSYTTDLMTRSYSSVPAVVTNRGQAYVTALLEAPKEWDD